MSIWKKMIAKQQEERRKMVINALKKSGNQSKAARDLGISRQQLYEFIKRNKIQEKDVE